MRRLATRSASLLALVLTFGASSAGAYQVTPKATLPTKTEAAKSKADDVLIDINTADLETLQTLPGIGPVLAKEIVAGRPYANVSQLSKISGLGDAKLAELKGKVIARRPKAEDAKEETPKAKAKAASKETTKEEMPKAKAKAKAATKEATKDEPPSDGPVDLNTADLETLQTLPGIGPVLAKEIVAGRPFATVDELSKVSGMGPAKLAELKGKVVASKPAPAPTPIPAAPAEKSAAKKAAMPKGEATAATKSAVPKLAPNEKVNLNTATKDKLDALPGIGPVKAQAIIDARPFKTVEDVMTVKGIKEDTFSKIKEFIIVR
ncbi:helix-hairpin-helix domain-containing protein [Isosphaeraceae bacterium EP7]